MPTLLQSWLQNHKAYEASGRKLAMIIGPGGNAGVIGSGSICAMWQTQSLIPNALYIGSSVGAYCWLYTLTGEGYNGATSFGRFYCDNRFFNPTRLLTPHPPLGLNFVVHEVLEHHIPMPYAVAETSPYNIQAISTDSLGKPTLLPLTGVPKKAAQQALHITAAMPLIGRTTNLEDLSNWDGWLIEPQLLTYLQTQGVTDVVWILNRPVPEKLPLSTRLVWKHIVRKLRRINPTLATLVTNRLNAGDFLANPPAGMQLEVIHPHADIPGTTRNPRKLFHALGTAYRHMAAYLGHPGLPYPTEWQPWQNHMPHE